MSGKVELQVVKGIPGIHLDDLEPLGGWLQAPREDEEGLVSLLEAAEPVALHPYDEDLLQASAIAVRQASGQEGRDTAWTAMIALVASLRGRYAYGYPDDLGTRVRAVRRTLSASRGPPIYAGHGAFRRGDLVSRPVAREGEVVAVHDGVFLDAEPQSDHTRQYGRMAAIHVLSPREVVDRWYVDHLYAGIDFGRPF